MRTIDTRVDHEQRQLERAATLFAVAVLVHNLDHVRRGAEVVHGDVFLAGTLAMVPEILVVAAVFTRHRAAPLAAAVIGFSLAAGYVVVHFTPGRSFLSDTLLSSWMPVSVLAAGFEAIGALLLGIVGWRVVRRRGLAAMGQSDRTPSSFDREGLRHPVVVMLVAGNALILVISLVQYFG